MSKYDMPNHRAWLDSETEILFDSCTSTRVHGDDPFTGFTDVLRRSNPLLPLLLTGPLPTLSNRLCTYWQSVPQENIEFYDLKLQLLAAFCTRLEHLKIFRPGSVERARAPLEGVQFYMRPGTRNSTEYPFLNARRGERLEAAETLYFITVILSTAEDEPQVPPMPEGPVRYIPYYDVPRHLTAPKRDNAASLAAAAKFFRLDTRPEANHRVFRFEFAAEGWAWGPNLEARTSQQASLSNGNENQGMALLNDEDGYRRIARVTADACSIHGAVSYFVLKLIAVLKEHTAFQSQHFLDRDETLTTWNTPLYTPLALISPLLIFARSQITLKHHPGPGSLLHMYTYGCTPICVNGVVDMGVYEFQKDLIDGVIEKAFVRDSPYNDMEAAWRRFGIRMVPAVTKLKASPEPVMPEITNSLQQKPAVGDEETAEHDGNSRSVPHGLGSGDDVVLGQNWDMDLTAPDQAQRGNLGLSLDLAAQHDCSHALFSYSKFAHPPDSSITNLRASDLEQSLAPNRCINPALIQEPSAIAALSASIASMEFEPRAAPSSQPIVEGESPPAEPMEAESPPAKPMEAESSPIEPMEAELPPVQPMEAESPPAEPIEAESGPDEPIEPGSPPPTEPIEVEPPPVETTNPQLSPAEPIEAESPPAEPIEAEAPIATPSQAEPPHMQPINWTDIAPGNVDFNDSDDLTDLEELTATSRKERGTPAATKKKAAKGRSKSVAVPRAPDGIKKNCSGRTSARDTGHHPASKRRRSHSLETEDSVDLKPAPTASVSNNTRRQSRVAPKKRRLESPADVAPMVAAFPLNPVIVEGPVIEYGDLLQPSADSTDSGSGDPAMEVDVDLPGPRMTMSLELPTTIYDPKADEIRIEKRSFCFPYQAVVDYTGKPLPEEEQPDCKPILQMVELWRQSEEESDMSRPNVRVISKPDFLALSEEDRGELLDDFLIIKDTNVPPEFFPRPIASPPVAVKPAPLAANDEGEIFVTDEMESATAPLMARLLPFVPYKNSVDVTFRSVASLAPGKMLDTGLLDICVRYLHKNMRHRQPIAAKTVVTYTTMFWVALCKSVIGDASPDQGAPTNPTGRRAQLRHLAGGLPTAPADYWVLPLHGFAHFALAIVVKPWSCLSEDSSEKTTVLYFDSLPERSPLASSGLIARAIIELDAIRAQMPAKESVDVGFAAEVKRRIAFIRVKASRLSNASPLSEDANTSALQVQPQKAGTVDCGLHVVHNVRVLFEKWTVNIAGILAGCGDDMFKDKLDVDALRHEMGDWLLLNAATPITLSSYDCAHWSSLPPSLAWMHLSYVHHYVEKRLGMDPHVVVQVQDLASLAHGKPPEHRPMKIGEVGLELLKGADAKRLNALSMASSGIHNASEIHIAVSDDNRSLVACSSGGIDATLTSGVAVGLNAWRIMSGPGTFHSSHWDANGLMTMISVVEGLKGWCWGRRKGTSGPLVPLPGEGDGWHWRLFKDYYIYLVVLGPGDTGILGAGVPHTVVSLQQAGFQHVPTVMTGSHFLNRFRMVPSLHGAIKHAFWHDVWTNATHDDRDFSIARMLAWQAMRMDAGAAWPFKGKNLYALLTMGLLPLVLQSLPFSTQVGVEWLDHYNPLDDPPFNPTPSDAFLHRVREKMAQITHLIIKQLPGPELAGFQRFWKNQRTIFIQEFQGRCNYNKEKL